MRGGLAAGGRGWCLVFSLSGLGAVLPAGAGSQAGTSVDAALNRAMDLEGANNCREAIPLYRRALALDDPSGALLGLERCYHAVGRPDSLVPVLDSVLARRPTDPTIRSVQLRTLSLLRAEPGLRLAFESWAALTPRDPSPYRAYARVLLEEGRTLAADSVLREAVRRLGTGADLAVEFAQMQAALGLWVAAAASWREASDTLSYLEQAAVFSLGPAPAEVRDSLRATLRSPPIRLAARRVLAGLELHWNAPREAWAVLAEVPPSDSAVMAWLSFAQDAEFAESWLTARDAYAQAARYRPADRSLPIKAAAAALAGGEPAAALELLAPLDVRGDSLQGTTVALLRVRALAQVGRAADIERVLRDARALLDSGAVRQVHRSLAWAWIRVGDLARARRALSQAGGTEEDARIAAWIALYEGDLRTARAGLRRTDETSRDVVTAMALLSRTRADTSSIVGEAFLALSRRDTLGAAGRFVAASRELPEAASFLLAAAGRLYAVAGDTARAVELWSGILASHGDSPEAAESELEWARVLRRRGEGATAIAHLEHLILTWPQSALVPQARRELDLARGRVPPPSSGPAAESAPDPPLVEHEPPS